MPLPNISSKNFIAVLLIIIIKLLCKSTKKFDFDKIIFIYIYMLYNKKDIPELHEFYHRNDDLTKKYVDYENVILNNTLSSYIFNNPIMAGFLRLLNSSIAMFFDQFNIIKNWKNFTVDKYWYKHVD